MTFQEFLKRYPDTISKDTEYITLNNWYLTDIDGIERYNKLVKLEISNNKITTLPDLSNLQNLELLDVSFNNLTELSTLSKLNKLKQFNCAGNKINTWEDSGYFSLEEIVCCDNKLKTLPTNLQFIKYIDCRDNKLESLPDKCIFSILYHRNERVILKLSGNNLPYNDIREYYNYLMGKYPKLIPHKNKYEPKLSPFLFDKKYAPGEYYRSDKRILSWLLGGRLDRSLIPPNSQFY